MDDDVLKKYIPTYGDRLAVMQFCKTMSNNAEEKAKTAKSTLIEKLRNRLKKRKAKADEGVDKEHAISRFSHKKNDRRIELGWLDYDPNMQDYRQVRAKCGGGTRHLIVSRESTVADLIESAKTLFFPNGVSSRGKITDYTVSMQDYSRTTIPDEIQVGELYDTTKLKMLRFYLTTKKLEATCTATAPKNQKDSNDDSVEELTPYRKRKQCGYYTNATLP